MAYSILVEVMMPISVLIADDHGVLRGGLRALLKAEPDLEVVGEAADGDAALTLAAALQPNVLLADISMPGPSGIDIAARLKTSQPDTHVLILTMHDDASLVEEAMRAGASGYIVKRAVEVELIKAIRIVAAGGQYVHPEIGAGAAAARRTCRDPAASPAAALTERENEILRLTAQGHTTQHIAATLGIGPETVDAGRAAVYKKLGLRGRIELTKYARDRGLI
jgi:two-component system, NarL family, response regulator NreC